MPVQPNTSYQWKDDAKFELNGKEFELVINTIRAILSTPESQKVMLLAQTNNVLEALLAKGVESGNVFPVEQKEEQASSDLEEEEP